MWQPTNEDFVALRVLGLATMALLFAVPTIPALRPHARRIGLFAAGLYLVGGLGFLAWRIAGR